MTAPNRRKLTHLHVTKAEPKKQAYLIWDTVQRGLVLRIEPTSYRAYKVIYRHGGRTRWLHLAAADAISLTDARKKAAEVMLAVMNGNDPAAEKKAERGRGTFEELAARYVSEYSSKKNKSYKQAEKLVQRNLLPRIGKLQADKVNRADIKAAIAAISAPITANQTLAAASAIFTWAIKEEILKINPCVKIDRNETTDRDRILSDNEIPLFFEAFDLCDALKVLLLTGQRPGEVQAMRWEHIQNGWWSMPGKPVAELGWPGTKNGEPHRIWLPEAVRAIIGERKSEGFVFDIGAKTMQIAMRTICSTLGVNDKVTPHDLRRTHGTKVAKRFGREVMNRIENHKEGGIADVYDRNSYEEENKLAMNTVAAEFLALASGTKPASNVVRLTLPAS
ncbi:integrase family protein [Bradyrhizobium diazoefficiens]|nr:integrase family protein [Bradyrhizobium diazoefficiens]MBR0847116.1 integrase family protein [Bradyrhizobium diazoefficiens]